MAAPVLRRATRSAAGAGAVAFGARCRSALLRPPVAAARHVRTGFDLNDPMYIDPDTPLLAERVGSRWRYMDDPALQASVLERSNVGMGMLVLNRREGLDLPTVNDLYRRLRNLEVNSLKRCVGLTANDPGPFGAGIDPRELLLAATLARRDGRLPDFSRALLWNYQELAHLIYDYRKPLLCQISGAARAEGAAMGCLANFSGAHEDSEVRFDAARYGLTPMGGATLAIARANKEFAGLGTFLALTGAPLRGADIVYARLAEHWLAPEALPFLELTSEKQLEVSEADAWELLHEHSLPLPEGFHDGADRLAAYGEERDLALNPERIALVQTIFAAPRSVTSICSQLRTEAGGGHDLAVFAKACLQRIESSSQWALGCTLHLINAEGKRRDDGRPDCLPSLKRELAVLELTLGREDPLHGCRALCLGAGFDAMGSRGEAFIEDDRNIVEDAAEAGNFFVMERSDISLSAHPRLRRYHPDYDPATTLDHDPAWMAQEADRWDPGFYAEERSNAIEELEKLTGRALSRPRFAM